MVVGEIKETMNGVVGLSMYQGLVALGPSYRTLQSLMRRPWSARVLLLALALGSSYILRFQRGAADLLSLALGHGFYGYSGLITSKWLWAVHRVLIHHNAHPSVVLYHPRPTKGMLSLASFKPSDLFALRLRSLKPSTPTSVTIKR